MAPSHPHDEEKQQFGDTSASHKADISEYSKPLQRGLIMMALFMSLFLVNLDQNIISTAIPTITDEFGSLDDVAWYGSAYLLTTCSFQLLMGKIYKFYPAKPVFMTFCTLFEVGSAICGAAPNSTAFIIGRAIAGLGSGGMLAGVLVIMFYTIPLQQRPIFQGAYAAVFAVASVIGPLIGGAFVNESTWRWCFYINLPIGAVVILVVIVVVHLPGQKLEAQADGWLAKLKQLDPIGTLAFFPGIVSLILALQWGGTKYAWRDARIIVLFVLCGVFCAAFIGIQIWKQESATVPPRIIKKRTVAAALWFAFFNGIGATVMTYYLPIWFQAVKGVSAVESGIMLLPLILSTTISAMMCGGLVTKIGYYNPFFLLSSVLMPIGAGLLSTLSPDAGSSKWIGYQVIFGIGFGAGAPVAITVVQTVLDKSDMATGSALVMFARFFGAAIFLPVAQNLFLSSLISKVANLPGVNPGAIADSGATNLKDLVLSADLPILLSDYNSAIMNVFYLVVGTSAITVVGSVLVEWRSLSQSEADRAKEGTKGTA